MIFRNFMNEFFHKPVMLKEVLDALDPRPDQHFIDATLGAGGHAEAILKQTAPHGKLLGIDRDPEMLGIARERLAAFGSRLIPVCAPYNQMRTIAKKRMLGPVQGVLFDLGLSSWHLEHSGRGFSFQSALLRDRYDEPLDMRFNPAAAGPTAAEILNSSSQDELARIFVEYGEEPRAHEIAKAIVRQRKRERFEKTGQLVEIIGKRRTRVHPATKVFQALRIAVNHELEFLEKGLSAAIETLTQGGKIAAIAFQGLEARVIKNTFRLWEREQKGRRVNAHAIAPSREEIRANSRARSAHLYIFHHI